MGTIKPTIRLRRLGLELKGHREAAGYNLAQAERLLKRSASSISRIEKGLHHPPERDVEYFLNKYGVTEAGIYQRLYALSRDGRKRGWWQRYGTDLSPETMDLIGLEADAVSIDFFELCLIPGLLQTEDYARAVISTGPFGSVQEQLDRLVTVRMKRQEVLIKPRPPHVWAIIDESALHRPVGSSDVMRMQLSHLVSAARLPHVKLQVLPFQVGEHPCMTGAFKILDIGERGDLQVVIVDSLTQITYREEEAEVRRYADAFHRLKAAALPEADSLALIERLVSET
ncbi:helix-turn-helix domain-containing protein [Actinomadura scrupuli]|uniref:helix-turn-helix domain-containing protein n=1 Tax=Actinomadura scrupuli TaxID=559629 RepID=UPI003D9783E5